MEGENKFITNMEKEEKMENFIDKESFGSKEIQEKFHKMQEEFSDALEDETIPNFDKAKEIKENFRKYLNQEGVASESQVNDFVDKQFMIKDEEFDELEKQDF